MSSFPSPPSAVRSRGGGPSASSYQKYGLVLFGFGSGMFFLLLLGGFGFILSLLLGVVGLILGATCRLYLAELGRSTAERDSSRSSSSSDWITYEGRGSSGQKVPPTRSKLDMRISGSAIIDEIIHDMIDYILRDYVHSWYDYVSEDDEFIHSLRGTIQEALVNLSSRVKEVDWTPYLTTQLVDEAATHLRLYRTAVSKVKENPNLDLLSVFFDLEASMEKNLCRDMVCIDESHLNDYFEGIIDAILFLLLPSDTYNCSSVGTLTQGLLVSIFGSALSIVADPDFVNQCVIWLCEGYPASSDAFLSVIRSSESIDEMVAAQEYFKELHDELKSSLDRANGDDQNLKQQVKCVNVVRKCIDTRLSFLKEGKESGTDWTDDCEDGWQNYFLTPGIKVHTLSLLEILNNSVATSYFLDFMNGVGGSNYILMYLNVSAWKTLADQQFATIEKFKPKDHNEQSRAMMECLKTAASNVYKEFVPDTAKHRVRLPDSVSKRFCIEMQTSSVCPTLFDDVIDCLIDAMEGNEKYYQGFLKSKHYIKCLMELDLLRTDSVNSASDDEDDDLASFEDFGLTSESERNNVIGDEYQTCLECLKIRKQQDDGLTAEDILLWERGYLERKYKLKAEIIEAGLTSENGKQFGVYAIQVVRTEDWGGRERRWHIYRRYSDFYDFHQWIKSKWMRLNKIEFPSKHTFRSTDRTFLEKRMGYLNKYLDTLMEMTKEDFFGDSLKNALLHFFEPGCYVMKKKQLSDKLENFVVNPLKQSVKSVTSAVKSAPDSFISTLDGFTKMFYPKQSDADQIVEAIKVGASIDVDADDNIPLRITLLLLDEVFDLKERNQWLRRRIVAFCREIFKAMYGDTINRRIIDHVAFLTNPLKVSGYLRYLQRTLWPNGQRATEGSVRDADTKARTRIAAKVSLFSCISDELKRLLGSETTRRGLLCVFDMLQNRILNRRLTLVLFEGILKTLFPDKPIMEIVQRLHFRSNRVGKNRPFLMSSHVKTGIPSTLVSVSPTAIRKKKSA